MEVCIIEQKAEVDTKKYSLKIVLYDSYVVVVGEVKSRKVMTKKSLTLAFRENRVAHELNPYPGYILHYKDINKQL